VGSYRLGLLHGALAVGLLLAVWVACHAQTWIVGNGIVHHIGGAQHCHNTFTPGVGLELGNTALGVYSNSNCRWSAYAAQAWTPLRYGPLRAGVIGGLVSGYSAPMLPVAAFIASLEGQKYGVNLLLIPPPGGSGEGVTWVQFKVRW
jgi:hypothetical protein